MKSLKYIRRVVASVVLLLSVLMFVDFAGLIPIEFSMLMKIQFIPALLAGSWIIVLSILLSVFILGRLYCSVLCPLGIMKDLVSAVRKAINKLRGKKKRRLTFTKAKTLVRYLLMAISFLSFILGSSLLLLLLDPYSNFGRITTAIFRPIYMWVNNILAIAVNAMGNYSLYRVTPSIDIPSFIFVTLLFTAILVLAWRRERLWCNSICPVGTLLGVCSRFSFLKVVIDPSKCNSCSKCSKKCKSHCIDTKSKQVDNSRCVTCYNCLSTCKQGAIKYGLSFPRRKAPAADSFDKSRHNFIANSLLLLTATPLVKMAESLDKASLNRTIHPIPPGATSDFLNKCTACHLCINKCPMGTLRPAFTERGISGFMQPIMYFKPHAYCNYECTICSEVCPTGALLPLTVEQKKLRQVGYVRFVISECVVEALGQDCGACAEHCPTGAVKMIPYKGSTIPDIETDICIGCGACESICPVRPRAIFIEGNEIQIEAKKPHIQEVEEVTVDDFGF